MAAKKQVMDMRSEKNGVSVKESNEQQRNWSEKQWQAKASDSLANYDPSRAHLNFEVARGGVIRPIDTSKSIDRKMKESLASRGIQDPNARPDARRKQRTLAKFIFGGNNERMREMAFGTQQVDFSKGADNSGIMRCKDIEDWARDVYNFVADKFGEDNIVGFYVHLDEKSPHLHCTVIPVNEQNKISWRSVFGQTPQEESTTMSRLHDEFAKEVGSKWGLERGDSIAETKAKHRSTEEYKRQLVNEVCSLESTREELTTMIHRAEIKLKSLTTMIANLENRREEIQSEIKNIAQQFGQNGISTEELALRMSQLRKELEEVNAKLTLRHQMLDETNVTLEQARQRLAGLRHEHAQMKDIVGDDIDRQAAKLEKDITATYNKMVSTSLKPLMPTLTSSQQEVLERSGYAELTSNSQCVINCAMLLALRYIDEATNYAESCGGGGSPGAGWGKDKDDDDERWWMRCIAQSAAMLRPMGQRRRRR